MPVTSTDAVFAMFQKLPNSIERHGFGQKRFVYIPGEREYKVLLVAHADTFWDLKGNISNILNIDGKF